MAHSGNDALWPGIHVQFCHTPNQADVKCVTYCSDKRFLSVDDSSNVTVWVRVQSAETSAHHTRCRHQPYLSSLSGCRVPVQVQALKPDLAPRSRSSRPFLLLALNMASSHTCCMHISAGTFLWLAWMIPSSFIARTFGCKPATDGTVVWSPGWSTMPHMMSLSQVAGTV